MDYFFDFIIFDCIKNDKKTSYGEPGSNKNPRVYLKMIRLEAITRKSNSVSTNHSQPSHQMNITATHINYYHVCKRKLWLFINGITMEHTSDVVYDGKLLHETSYPQRNEKHSELSIEACYKGISLYGQIDFYDSIRKIIHETKRSDKIEIAHTWQAKFYLWLMKLNGIDGVTATLEYPKIRQTNIVGLLESDVVYLEKIIDKIIRLKDSENCPAVINSRICKSCSYYELCYVGD